MDLRSAENRRTEAEKSEKDRKYNLAKVQRWREKKRQDPDLYKNMKKKESERQKKLREKKRSHAEKESKKGNQEMLEKIRKQKREEMKLYRQRKKQKELSEKRKIDQSKQRTDDMEEETPEQIDKLRKKLAVERTKQWRLKVKLKNTKTNANNETENDNNTQRSAFSNRYSRYRQLKKVKQVMPETPKRKAEVVKALVSSPGTSKILETEGIINSPKNRDEIQVARSLMPSINESVKDTTTGNSSNSDKSHANKILKVALQRHTTPAGRKLLNKYLNLSLRNKTQKKDWWKRQTRKKRRDALSDDVKVTVRNFYLSAEVSREVPNKKDVVKIKDQDGSKTALQKHTMTMTLEESYKQFKTSHPEMKIGLTSFKKLKPVNVKKISETSRRTCLCQICCNIALKCEALKNHIKSIQTEVTKGALDGLQTDKHALSNQTLCQPLDQNKPRPACLERSCDLCGTSLLKDYLKPVIEKSHNKVITWYHWEPITITKDDKVKRCISCVEKNTSFTEFVEEIQNDLKAYPEHIFRATWQQQQMTKCLENLTEGSIAMMVMDFSENYGCLFQSEVQSGFFDRNQVTIHPMMCYYYKSDVLVKHAIIGISEDTKHDADAVLEFENQAMAIIENCTDKDIKEIHEWTDGCAAQYKGKKSFADISCRKYPSVTRNFFETSHGKNVCDGLGAIVKNSCYQAVISKRNVIGTAADVYRYCKDKLEMDQEIKGEKTIQSKREFIFVDKVKRDRTGSQVETLKGTRKLHCVKSIGINYSLDTRKLSCYCNACCEIIADGRCSNIDYCKDWERKKLQKVAEKSTQHVLDAEIEHAGKLAPEQQLRDISIYQSGTFVAVCLKNQRGPAYIFMAEVVRQTEDGDVQVRYMRKTNGGNYVWPEEADMSCEPIDHIVSKLSPPTLVNERGHFVFKADEILAIKKEQVVPNKSVYFR